MLIVVSCIRSGRSVGLTCFSLLTCTLLFFFFSFYFFFNDPATTEIYTLSLHDALPIFTFLPFLSVDFIKNFTFTIGLWFQKFEFNASVYYLIRWIGFKIVGWNIIETVGKILPLVTFLCILVISFFRRNMNLKHLIQSMLFAVSIYLMLSTTVHPWYITTPLILSVFTNYKFPLVWSLMIFLSYSAYGKEGVNENLLLVAIEYITIISIALWEISRSKGNLKLENSNDKHIV